MALHLFEAFGVELEYMIVREDDLSVCPVADRLIFEACGSFANEVERGKIAWSNELVLHVLELKCNGPSPTLDSLPALFHEQIQDLNRRLRSFGAKLLPTGAHPFMNPETDTLLWPHGNQEIYQAYHRIFNCRGHGWSNLQSTHLNLPFGNDEEFGHLHAAIRLLLPILPALSASTPILDGKPKGFLDSRLEVYRHNQKNIPSISGKIIPERVFTKRDYVDKILKRMYQDIAPLDPENILQDEWLNSRGAIARFDRDAIEIRVLDTQECPAADVAILQAVVNTLKTLISETWISYPLQKEWEEDRLQAIFFGSVKDGGNFVVSDAEYLKIFKAPFRSPCTVMELWSHILGHVFPAGIPSPVKNILQHGSLSERILRALGPTFSKKDLVTLYHVLASSLENNRPFIP